MSDAQRKSGWWQASDLNWYPPESHPDYHPALPAPPPGYVPAKLADREFESGATAKRVPRVQGKHLLILAVCVAYVLSPIDVLPEVILGPLGLPDDLIAVVGAIGVYVAGVRRRHNGP